MAAFKVEAPRLRFLAPVLRKWTAVVTKVSGAWRNEDVPFWYNERAHVGLFAGAVWLRRGLAFEEYTSTKRGSGGRCDLWFELNHRAFIAEAKFINCPASAGSNPEPLLRKKLATAKKDARRNKAWSNNEQRLALLFVAVEVSDTEDVEQALTEWKRRFALVQADASAWVFPTKSRYFKSRKARMFYPGCALLVAKV